MEHTSSTFVVRGRTRVVDWPYRDPNTIGRPYDVSPDGKRFLVVDEVEHAGPNTEDAIVVVPNWFTELERLVPTK